MPVFIPKKYSRARQAKRFAGRTPDPVRVGHQPVDSPKTLGLEFNPQLLATADELIE
jgi:hypothetical protein